MTEQQKKAMLLIVEVLGVDPDDVRMETNLADDLGCDDLDMVELAMRLETEFNCSIADDALDGAITVAGLLVAAGIADANQYALMIDSAIRSSVSASFQSVAQALDAIAQPQAHNQNMDNQKTTTQRAVELATLLLIETNGSTTTLEVKGLLRASGYRATQDEVSSLMEANLGNAGLSRERHVGDAYYTYSLVAQAPTGASSVAYLVPTPAPADPAADTWTAYQSSVRAINKEYPATLTRRQAMWKFCVECNAEWDDVRCCKTSKFEA